MVDIIMKVLFIITLVCAILNITTLCKSSIKIKNHFTDEEWKIIQQRNKKRYEWYINLMFICCPIINFMFALLLGFKINEVVEETVDKYKK